MPVRNPEDMEVTEEETVSVENQQQNNNTATSTTTSALDEDNYFEPIDYSKVGTYFVKEFDENTGKARWNIPNIAKLPARQYCDDFEIAGCPWRMLLFPRGNNVQSLSIYLDVPDARQQSATWTRYARFQISIINHKDPKKSVSQEAEKRFNSQETDWGFREFLPLSKLTVEEGFITESGFVVIECVVNVCKDPFLLNPASYDSKKETGFVGVKNQGATCYMNSLLQSWFHVTFLRKAVYKMPIEENEVPTSSIPLALQRVFYNLQSEKSAVDTKELTKSFGWDTIDSFLQHDVQELARVLTDNLEKKMEKTPAKGTMKYLFEGSIKNYIKCLNVNYESSRVETFYDLQLNVKGCKDVLASFKHYIEDEMLTGENQYHAEGHGLQDAKKGCIFMKFPPVLTLHLKRFEYDIQRDCMYKVNDRYEFPTVMDLNPYIAPESEFHGKDNTYTLFSVLVHSGNVDGGHYFAFIRPSTSENQWYKFDDEKVQKVRERDAVDENYGGTEDKKSKYFWLQSNSIAKKFTNAYMLVYIKTSEIENMLAPVGPEEVPEHLKVRVEKEREESEKRKKEKAEAHKFVQIRIASDKDLKQNVGTDLITNWEGIEPIKIKKSATLLELKQTVQEKTGIPAERQRFWKWEARQNRTYRPDSPIRENLDAYPLEKLFPLSSTQSDALNLYLEESKAAEGAAEAFVPFEKDHCLIFIKFYDPASRTLQYVGTVNATLKDKVQDLLPAINNLLGLDPQTQLCVYEEVKPSMIEPVNMRATLKQAELQIGDILAVQTPFLTPEEQQSHEYPTAPDYFKYLTQRTLIRFRKLEEPKQEAFTEEMLKSMTYGQVVTKLAEKLGTKPEFIRLTGNNPYADVPRTMPFKSTEVKSLKDMIVLSQNSTDILYYEILSEPISEFETKKELNIQWYNNKVELVGTHKLLVPKEETIANVVERLKQKVELSDPNAEIRVMEIFSNRIHKVFPLEATVDDVGSGVLDLRAEEVPAEEKSFDQAKGRLIQVVHFCKEGSGVRLFGAPFVFVLYANETLTEVKKRIQEKLGVKEEEFKKYKFAPISSLISRSDQIGDEDVVTAALDKVDTLKQHTVCLGMEHKDPTPRATTRWYDKPIVIKN